MDWGTGNIKGGEILRLLCCYLINFSSGGQASCAATNMAGDAPTLPRYIRFCSQNATATAIANSKLLLAAVNESVVSGNRRLGNSGQFRGRNRGGMEARQWSFSKKYPLNLKQGYFMLPRAIGAGAGVSFGACHGRSLTCYFAHGIQHAKNFGADDAVVNVQSITADLDQPSFHMTNTALAISQQIQNGKAGGANEVHTRPGISQE